MNDILVFGTSKSEHKERLHAVLRKLTAASVTLNRAKCSLGVREVAFLGYVVDPTGIKPDPGKVQTIKEMVAPSAVTDVRRFLGMVDYFVRFIPNLATLSAPLRELLVKGKDWHWGQPHERAFACLKQLVSSARCVAKFDHTLPTVLSADASSFGIGVVLLQVHPDGQKRAVAQGTLKLPCFNVP